MSGGGPRDDERIRHLLMAELDGELEPDERRELENELAASAELRAEHGRLQRVKEVTESMKLEEPPEEVWETYWESVYNRFERGVGWLLFSLGVAVLLIYGTWEAVDTLVADDTVPRPIKLAVFAAAAGGLVLLFSVAREKWFTRRRDRYRGVQR